MECVPESASGTFQSTWRKPGDILTFQSTGCKPGGPGAPGTQEVRRLAPAALTGRTHPAGSVTHPRV